MKNYYLISLIFSLLSFLILACGGSSTSEGEEADAQTTPSGNSLRKGPTIYAVSTMPVQKGVIRDYIKLNGDVESDVSVSVFPDVPGRVSRTLVKLGDYVRRGQTIMQVDPSRPGTRFALNPVLAPVEGYVTSLPQSNGATVGAQTAVAVVSQLNNLKIITYVAERFISRLALRQRAVIGFYAYPERSFTGVVSKMAPVVHPSKRTLEIEIDIDENDEEPLNIGMFGEIKLIVEEKDNIIKIPRHAIIDRYGERFVFVVQRSTSVPSLDQDMPQEIIEGSEILPLDEESQLNETPIQELPDAVPTQSNADEEVFKVEKRLITLGIEIDGMAEIQGLEPGEEIVVRGQNSLDDQSQIRIVETLSPLPSGHNIEL